MSASLVTKVAEKLTDVIKFPELEDEADDMEGDGVSSVLEIFRLLPTICDTSPAFSKKAATSGSRRSKPGSASACRNSAMKPRAGQGR